MGGGGIWEYKQFFFLENNYFSFNVFFVFFYAGNIEKCPFTYWLNGRWFLQIVDIRVGNFNMKLTGRWFPQIVGTVGSLVSLWSTFHMTFDDKILNCFISTPNGHLYAKTFIPSSKFFIFFVSKYAILCKIGKL